jgi:HEAT repeat protein
VEEHLREASGSDKSIIVRHEIALALVHFKSEQTLRALVRLAKDSAVEVRDSAEYALTEMLFGK